MSERGLVDLERDKVLWIPNQVDRDNPVDGLTEPEDRRVHLNVVPGEVEIASPKILLQEQAKHGVKVEPELARELWTPDQTVLEGGQRFGSYLTDHPTHFRFRSDVGKAVVRVQKKFPWSTFANTYFRHPPVYGQKYEFVSVDYWAGGVVNGRYVGYRGKNINIVIDGWKVFNAAFNDPFTPNIAWIIFGGRMWSRGYGWGPAPWGPPDSDPGHYFHVHITYVL